MVDPHENGPRAECLLVIEDHIRQTAVQTAAQVKELLAPWMARVESLEDSIKGNGTPGLRDEVRMLKQAHDDSIRMRHAIYGYFGLHAVALIGAIVAGVLWYGRVETHMLATDRWARIELRGDTPAILKSESGQIVVVQPGNP